MLLIFTVSLCRLFSVSN